MPSSRVNLGGLSDQSKINRHPSAKEMDRIGALETLLPSSKPADLWNAAAAGRGYTRQGEPGSCCHLVRIAQGRAPWGLGPTHTRKLRCGRPYPPLDLLRSSGSCRPCLYQIQKPNSATKSAPAISGLMRALCNHHEGCPILSMSAWGQPSARHLSGMDQAYLDAFFQRCGLRAVPVEATAAPSVASASQEFMVNRRGRRGPDPGSAPMAVMFRLTSQEVWRFRSRAERSPWSLPDPWAPFRPRRRIDRGPLVRAMASDAPAQIRQGAAAARPVSPALPPPPVLVWPAR